jgi:hypothetical protein
MENGLHMQTERREGRRPGDKCRELTQNRRAVSVRTPWQVLSKLSVCRLS